MSYAMRLISKANLLLLITKSNEVIILMDYMRYKVSTATVIIFLASVVVTGCSTNGYNKSNTGLAVGAITGGLLGSTVGKGGGRVAAAITGAAIGGIVGSEIGNSLDKIDRQYAKNAEIDALENGRSGVPVRWRNPDSGRHGEIIPSPPFSRGHVNCRRYHHKVYIDGHIQTLRGTACRNSDGTWSNTG
ncbi:MAG: hypothetical protein TECD_00413 [Hyphomicrobiaceae bacterium hypho_1]